MKILKFFGNSIDAGYSLQGIKTLYDDGVARNDLQTVMAVINWQNATSGTRNIWCFGDGSPILFGDGSKIVINESN